MLSGDKGLQGAAFALIAVAIGIVLACVCARRYDRLDDETKVAWERILETAFNKSESDGDDEEGVEQWRWRDETTATDHLHPSPRQHYGSTDER